jgi:hypothetical protein
VVDHGGAWIPRRSTPRHAAATRFADIGSPFVGCHVDADGGSRTPTDRCLRPVPLPGWATSACDVDATDMRGRGTRTTGARRSRAGKRSASSAAQRRRQTQLGSIRVFSRDAPAAPVGGAHLSAALRSGPRRRLMQIACDVESRLPACLELHDLRRAHRDLRRGTPNDVEMRVHLGSFRTLEGAARLARSGRAAGVLVQGHEVPRPALTSEGRLRAG